MRLAPVLSVAASVTLSIASRPALADPDPTDASAAKARFSAAQELYDQREFAAALPAFREVHRALGSPNAHLYLARCLRELGQLPEAYEELSATLAEAAARAEKEPRFLATRDAAAADRALLEAKVARLVVAVAKPPPGLEVLVAGKILPAARLGQPIALAPGKTRVVATAPGRAGAREDVTLAVGALETVSLSLDPPSAPAPVAAPTPAPRHTLAREAPLAPAAKPDATLRYVGFGVAAIGVGGFLTAAITGAMANARFRDVRDECGGMRCLDPAVNDRIDGGRSLDTAANVALAVGAIGVAGGAAMVWFGGPPLLASSRGVGLAAAPGGGVIRGAF